MWVRNKQTGLKWDVSIERAEELIESGEYEGVDREEQEPVKGKKRNAKPD